MKLLLLLLMNCKMDIFLLCDTFAFKITILDIRKRKFMELYKQIYLKMYHLRDSKIIYVKNDYDGDVNGSCIVTLDEIKLFLDQFKKKILSSWKKIEKLQLKINNAKNYIDKIDNEHHEKMKSILIRSQMHTLARGEVKIDELLQKFPLMSLESLSVYKYIVEHLSKGQNQSFVYQLDQVLFESWF